MSLTPRRALQNNALLVELLKDSPIHRDGAKRRRVEKVLKDLEDDVSPERPIASVRTAGKRLRSASSSDAEDDRSKVSKDATDSPIADSDHEMDVLEEDALSARGLSGTGYIGRESPVHWLQTLQDKIEVLENELPRSGRSSITTSIDGSAGQHDQRITSSRGGTFTRSYFYLNSTEIEIDVQDPHAIPPEETATRLFECFQVAAHSPFRILNRTFAAQVRSFYFGMQSGSRTNVSARWKACLNLVFAIGARYASLLKEDWHTNSEA